MRNALFILNSDFDALERKGVVASIRKRDEDGFFDQVWTVHPFAPRERCIELAENHHILEFSPPAISAVRLLNWIRFISHLARVVWSLARIVKRRHIDLVRAQDPYFCGLVGFLVSRIVPTRFCISIHCDYDRMHQLDPHAGALTLFGSRVLAKRLEKWLLGRADRVLSITRYIAGYAVANGAVPSRVRLFRHRVAAHKSIRHSDTQRLKDRSPAGGAPVIAVVSRLSDEKHIMDVPAIAAVLRERGVRFQLKVAGDGPRREALERELAVRKLNDHVQLQGFLDQQGVEVLLARSQCVLALHAGASLVEAGAAARPVVAYDWEWHRELVVDGDTGYLVAENDQCAAAAALRTLLEDDELATALGAALQKRTAALYDDTRLLHERRTIYEELLSMPCTRMSRLLR